MVVGLEEGRENLTRVLPTRVFKKGDIIWLVGEEADLQKIQEKKLIEWSYKKYPELCEVMAHRRQAYDRQDKFMKKLVEEGKVFVIRPEEQMIRHFENNNEKLLQCYQYGYDTMRKQFRTFEKFMEDKSSPR